MLVVQDGSNLERPVAILAHIPCVFALFDDIFVTAVWADPGPAHRTLRNISAAIFSSINSANRDSSGPSPAPYCFWAVLRTMWVWGILSYSFLSADDKITIPNIRHMSNTNYHTIATP